MKNNLMNKDTSLFAYIAGWISAIFGYFTLNEWAVIFGMIATIGGFLVTWYYKHQEYKLKKERLKNEKNRAGSFLS